MKQPRLIPTKRIKRKSFGESGLAFGGSLLKNSHAKSERPFSPRSTIHIVLRARAPFSLLKHGRRKKVAEIVIKQGKRHFVRIHRFANAGNHLHLLVECRKREKFRSFLRAVSGAIALFVKLDDLRLCGETSLPKAEISPSLWLQRPWTRLVAASGRAFVQAWRYVDLNAIEGDCWGVTRQEARRIQYGDIGPPKAWLRV